MSYIAIKTINGRQYRYLQTSYRVGKKVKTRSIYLGAVGGTARSIEHVPKFDEQKELQRQRDQEAAYEAMLERFTQEVGLVVTQGPPVMVEKPPTDLAFHAIAAPAAEQSGENSASEVAPSAATP
jgi:hypothetical protein